MSASVDVLRTWTVDDLETLPEDTHRYELVDGNLLMSPAATQLHQWQGQLLAGQLRRQAPDGWLVITEFSFITSPRDLRVPDLMVHRWPLQHPGGNRCYPLTPADVALLVEVVSPRTRKTDRFTTPGEYAEAGVPLYWRLETEPELVLHTYALDGDAYRSTGMLVGHGRTAAPWGEVDLRVEPVQV